MILLFGCADPVVEAPAPPAACVMASASSEGPLRAQREATEDMVERATLLIREARITGDTGFYTLAEVALDCADARTPDTAPARTLRAHLGIQFHRFAEVERTYTPMPAKAGWLDHALLGDAQMEQGRLDLAVESYQHAVDLRPGLAMYDRIGWIRWLEGDVEGALEMAKLAVSAGNAADPEPFAWALTRLGWLNALRGLPAPELDAALALVDKYPPALFARGRVRLQAGHVGAASDLYGVGPTVEANWARSEVDPTASVEAVKAQDSRGYAMWLSEFDPGAALLILEEEWKVRQDATTRMARAYARWRADGGSPATPLLPSGEGGESASRKRAPDPADEARAALATGITEPRVLRMGALILGDRALAAKALAMGPGLLPSERASLAGL